ncbi:MAG TPA: hypothetical protein VF266_22770 [Thermoanaerobaculia bacterium]
MYESSFTARYTFDRCVYFEHFPTQAEAIAREQQPKGWSRKRKSRSSSATIRGGTT